MVRINARLDPVSAAPVKAFLDAQVKDALRRKRDAEASDPASEIAESLAPSDVAETNADLDTDFQWAIAVASFAEIVGHSPYADIDNLGVIQSIVERPVYEDDADRAEFATLVNKAIPLLEGSSAAD